MAEVTGLRNNALPYPIYGAPFGVVFPMLDADGDLVTGATTPDAERSLNGDTFADCTNESVEIATASGMYYLLLTGAEMTADVVAVIAKSATAGMKTTAMVLYPRKLVSLRAGTAAGGAAGSITLDSGASAVDDYYNGCVVVGVLDSVTEVRIITDYVGSTKVASVTPNWVTTPDTDDTFTVYLPEGRQVTQADPVAFGGVGGTFSGGRPEVNSSHAAGTAWNSGAIGAATLAANTLNAAKVDPDVATEINAAVLAILGTPAGASMSVDIAAIEAQTDDIGAAGAGLTAADDAILSAIAALNNLSAAAVNAEVDTALTDYDGPTNAELATALGTADDAVLAQIAFVKAKTDSLTFTTAGVVDAHITHVAGEAVDGAGTTGDPWGPV